MKITVQRMTAEGEHIVVETEGEDIWSKEHVSEQMTGVLAALDARTWEMNKRIIAATGMAKRLSPEAQQEVHEVVDVLYGRKQLSAAQVANMNDQTQVEKAIEDARAEGVASLEDARAKRGK